MRHLMLFAILMIPACGEPAAPPADDKEPAATAPAASAGAPAPSPVAAWAGTWIGSEGTSLTIAPGEAGFDVTITNLDGPKYFNGRETAGGLEIVRDGSPLVIRAGTGADTGMKWLADKADCLVVGPNEGYCRG